MANSREEMMLGLEQDARDREKQKVAALEAIAEELGAIKAVLQRLADRPAEQPRKEPPHGRR